MTRARQGFIEGKLTISDSSIAGLAQKISRCCVLGANIEEIAIYAEKLQGVLGKLYHRGIQAINDKVYTHKQRGRWIVNYYYRTYDLKRSFKLKLKAKVVDVEHGTFSFAAFFYFDTRQWRTNYRGRSQARNLYYKTSLIGGRRVKDPHRQGGGKMLRPHATTWGVKQKIGINLIDILDKGFWVGGKQNPRKFVQKKGFIEELNKAITPQEGYTDLQGNTSKFMYKGVNIPIVHPVRSGRWTQKAGKYIKNANEKALFSLAKDMDSQLRDWLDNVLEIDEQYMVKGVRF